VGGPNSDEGTESLVLYVYYNPFTVNIPILYKPVFTQVEPSPLPSLGEGHPLPVNLAVHGIKDMRDEHSAFCAVGEDAQPCLAHSPTALNEMNLAVAQPFVEQMKKNFRSFLSTLFGTD
jgi:hypothetical protein